MKKRKKTELLPAIALQNPVAKFAGQFNKAHTFADKTKYTRHAKHRQQEAGVIVAIPGAITPVSCGSARSQYAS